MVVGHNPGIEYLIDLLTDSDERMPTAALAQVELSIEQWADLDDEVMGILVNVWRPKEL
jgi:phosphohistidine phosphatase